MHWVNGEDLSYYSTKKLYQFNKMSIRPPTCQQSVFKLYHGDKHFSKVLPTRWRQKLTDVDREQNHVNAVTLCIRTTSGVSLIFLALAAATSAHRVVVLQRRTARELNFSATPHVRQSPQRCTQFSLAKRFVGAHKLHARFCCDVVNASALSALSAFKRERDSDP